MVLPLLSVIKVIISNAVFGILFKRLLEEQSGATAQDCQEDATQQDDQSFIYLWHSFFSHILKHPSTILGLLLYGVEFQHYAINFHRRSL